MGPLTPEPAPSTGFPHATDQHGRRQYEHPAVLTVLIAIQAVLAGDTHGAGTGKRSTPSPRMQLTRCPFATGAALSTTCPLGVSH